MIRRALVAVALLLAAGPWHAAAQAPGLPSITFIRMIGPASGWAQTADRLLHTHDGGAHWVDVSPARGWTGRPTAAFLSASAAWAAPAPASGAATIGIVRTADAGRTWTRSNVSAGNVGQFAFVDARTGWMTADLDGAAGSEALRILRTVDGGATWAEIARTDLPGAPVQSGLPFNGDKTGFAFLDPRTGWMAGYVPEDNYSYLYVTRDSGATWQRQALPVPAGIGAAEFGLTAPFVFPPGDAVLVAQLRTAAAALSALYVTHDRGTHWTPTAPVPAAVSAAAFVTSRTGWVTDGTSLYATIDAGHHWTARPRGALFTGVTQLDFVSPAAGWAVRDGAPSLLRTADGGRTWVAAR